MASENPDIKADIGIARDDGEPVSLMAPLLLAEGSRHRAELIDLALELAQRNAGFRRSLPAGLVASLADLVRAMSCYYSNLIEGHDTHPVAIERALRNEFSHDPRQRDLQLEATAHIAVQRWIDQGGIAGRALAPDSIREIHRRFGERPPDGLRLVEDRRTKERVAVIPGALRRHDVAVGDHVAISAGAVPRFLERFAEAYGALGRTETILAAAVAHHRLLWIHPFLDGNGRVARLMSHAMLLDALDSGAVWSIARGLARDAQTYKAHLAACDLTRRNDLDGSGHLSEESLAAFTRFFLATCIDQVAFMESLVEPARLRTRILLWAEEETRLGRLAPRSGAILEAVLYRGELRRADLPAIVGTGARQARRVVATLIEEGVLVAASPRAPLRLAFPATLAARWLPGLFPAA